MDREFLLLSSDGDNGNHGVGDILRFKTVGKPTKELPKAIDWGYDPEDGFWVEFNGWCAGTGKFRTQIETGFDLIKVSGKDFNWEFSIPEKPVDYELEEDGS